MVYGILLPVFLGFLDLRLASASFARSHGGDWGRHSFAVLALWRHHNYHRVFVLRGELHNGPAIPILRCISLYRLKFRLPTYRYCLSGRRASNCPHSGILGRDGRRYFNGRDGSVMDGTARLQMATVMAHNETKEPLGVVILEVEFTSPSPLPLPSFSS